MHYAFDKWMDREHSRCPFERYADDVVICCDTNQQAQQLWADVAERLGSGGLELHPDKTKIVYCKDTNRRDEAQHTLWVPETRPWSLTCRDAGRC